MRASDDEDDVVWLLIVTASRSTLQTSFWPPILDHSTNANHPDPVGQGSKTSRQSKRTRRTARYATMRKVTLLVGIQIISISVAALGFSILALVLAVTVRTAVQRHQFARVYALANEVAAWIACLFGGVSECLVGCQRKAGNRSPDPDLVRQSSSQSPLERLNTSRM